MACETEVVQTDPRCFRNINTGTLYCQIDNNIVINALTVLLSNIGDPIRLPRNMERRQRSCSEVVWRVEKHDE
jgi:hypothetical protein